MVWLGLYWSFASAGGHTADTCNFNVSRVYEIKIERIKALCEKRVVQVRMSVIKCLFAK